MVRAARDQIARCDELLQRINMRRRLEPDTRTVVERLRVEDFPPEDWEVGPPACPAGAPWAPTTARQPRPVTARQFSYCTERQRDRSVMRAEGRPCKLFGKAPVTEQLIGHTPLHRRGASADGLGGLGRAVPRSPDRTPPGHPNRFVPPSSHLELKYNTL